MFHVGCSTFLINQEFNLHIHCSWIHPVHPFCGNNSSMSTHEIINYNLTQGQNRDITEDYMCDILLEWCA